MENTLEDQIRVAVCPSAEWRDAPFTGDPVPFKDFNVTSDDFDGGEYVQNVLVKNIITWVFFGITVLFLILFQLWRILRACCVSCCCAESCNRRRQKNTDILWTKKSAFLKVLIILSSLTAISLASYSSSNLEITLSEDAWKTIHAVRNQVAKVLNFGDGVLTDLEEAADLLGNVATVFQTEVDTSGMLDNLQCITDFLVNMDDPTEMKTALEDIDELLSVTLKNQINSFKASLDNLQTGTFDVISAPIAEVVAAESSFTDFASELGDLETAIDALEEDNNPSSAALTSANNLETARASVRDIQTFIDDLNSLKASLNTIRTSGATTSITNVENGIVTMSNSFESAAEDVSTVETQLQSYMDAYEDVSPCIADFKSTLSYIDTNVLDLPSEVSDNEALLDSVSAPLADFFGTDSETADVLQTLSDFSSRTFLPDSSTFQSQLSNAKTDISEIVNSATDFGDAIDALIPLLQSFEVEMNTLQTNLNSYIADSADSVKYTTMKDHAGGAFKLLISNIVTNVGAITTTFSDTFVGANGVASVETSLGSNLDAQKDDLDYTLVLIDGFPNLTDMSATLDDIANAYSSLGADPSTTLSDVGDMLSDVGDVVNGTLATATSAVEDAADEARDALGDARGDSVGEIDEFEAEKRNLTFNHFVNTPEDIGFALLADDVNDRLYFVPKSASQSIKLRKVFCSSTILVVENDACANLEAIVLSDDSNTELNSLLTYYFTGTGELRDVLLDAFSLDLSDLEAEAQSSADDARDIIVDWNTKGNLNDSLVAVLNKVDDITELIGELEQLFCYDEINPLYRTIKSFFCCDISSFLYTIWRDLTTTVVFLGFFALHKIDKMPSVDCCGCTCRRRYLDDILTDTEDVKLSPKQKISTTGPSRKGTQIGTEIV